MASRENLSPYEIDDISMKRLLRAIEKLFPKIYHRLVELGMNFLTFQVQNLFLIMFAQKNRTHTTHRPRPSFL